MKQRKALNRKKTARVRRTQARVRGSAERPRLAVFRSNRGMYVQLIDDAKGHTIASASSRDVAKSAKGPKSSVAEAIGVLIAKKGKAAGCTAVVFDRRSYRYHGRVKALAEAARKGGLMF